MDTVSQIKSSTGNPIERSHIRNTDLSNWFRNSSLPLIEKYLKTLK